MVLREQREARRFHRTISDTTNVHVCSFGVKNKFKRVQTKSAGHIYDRQAGCHWIRGQPNLTDEKREQRGKQEGFISYITADTTYVQVCCFGVKKVFKSVEKEVGRTYS